MVAQAEIAAASTGVENMSWRRMRGEELPGDLGRFDLVTFAQSFHWMDRVRVAASVRAMLLPGGHCVHVQAVTHRGDTSVDRLSRSRPPCSQIDNLVRSYLGPVRRAGRDRLPGGLPDGAAEIFRQAGFDGPTHHSVRRGEIVDRSVDEIIASTFSYSGSTPHLLGDRVGQFETDLRALLESYADDGLFSERVRDVVFDVWLVRD